MYITGLSERLGKLLEDRATGRCSYNFLLLRFVFNKHKSELGEKSQRNLANIAVSCNILANALRIGYAYKVQ